MEICLKKVKKLDSPNHDLENTNDSQDKILIVEPPLDFTRDPESYLAFKEIPVYEPTAEEFRQPIALINRLKEMGYDKSGCVKIRAPPEWDPKFSLSLQDKKITTRKQKLQDLTKGKVTKMFALK